MSWLPIIFILGLIIILALVVVHSMAIKSYEINRVSNTERKYISRGEEYASKCSIIIGGLARNAIQGTETIMNLVDMFSRTFKDVHLIILENDSEDKTREFYLNYRQKNNIPNLKVDLVNRDQNNNLVLNAPTFKTKLQRTYSGEVSLARIEKMALLRNQLLDCINDMYPKNLKDNENRYLYITDLDIVGKDTIEGVKDTFGHFEEDPNVDAIGVLGVTREAGFGRYFDPFAFAPYTGDDETRYRTVKGTGFMWYPPLHDGLYRIGSSFSGGVFIRYPLTFDKRCEAKLSKNPNRAECEHISFFKKMRLYINTGMIRNIYSHVS